MAAETAVPGDDVVMAAIDWMVRLQSGSATDHDHEACRRWRAEQPQHELAWQRLQSLSERGQLAARAGPRQHRRKPHPRTQQPPLCHQDLVRVDGHGLLAPARPMDALAGLMAGYRPAPASGAG
jgi:ferric-dicitrate binding protein FerR (iron transport regulator)